VAQAQDQTTVIAALKTENEEKQQRLKQIDENILSGDKFLNILAELKSRESAEQKGRISDDIYITAISTHIPKFLIALYGGSSATPKGPSAGLISNPAQSAVAANTSASGAPDTFQAQRRIYIRGFVTGTKQTELVGKVRAFWKNLVPHEDQPDHPDNLFKDVYDIWYGRPQQSGSNYMLEFVLEVYTEGTREETAPANVMKGPSRGNRPGARQKPTTQKPATD
jgi:hypothetical protein